jgi:hypothetical protein
MVESNKNEREKCEVKHFPVDKDTSFVQFTVEMTQSKYNTMMGQDVDEIKANPGKGKALI